MAAHCVESQHWTLHPSLLLPQHDFSIYSPYYYLFFISLLNTYGLKDSGTHKANTTVCCIFVFFKILCSFHTTPVRGSMGTFFFCRMPSSIGQTLQMWNIIFKIFNLLLSCWFYWYIVLIHFWTYRSVLAAINKTLPLYCPVVKL